MTKQTDDLIAEARAYIAAGVAKTPRHGFAIIADLADALVVAESRATEAEAARDAALAVIEKARVVLSLGTTDEALALSILSSVPADVLRERDRQVAERAWDEGARWAAVECAAIDDERQAWIAPGDNPYRTEEESNEDPRADRR